MAIALYARKSIERENSISCETQLEYCRLCIKPDEKCDKVLTYIDNGFSGGNTERAAFQTMMRQVGCGNITKLVVYRLDRISRSLSDFVNILEVLKKHGVKFVSSQEAFDTSSPYGEMIVKILMVFAEFERKSIIERVSQSYAHRSELGFYMGGRCPYGFRLKETILHGIKTKMYEPIASEVFQIEEIFSAYSQPNATLRSLMDSLLKRNILPKDKVWSTAKLSTILKNPIYVKADNSIYEYYSNSGANIVSKIKDFDGMHGLQAYGKTKKGTPQKIVVMPHHGLIPPEIWLRCQRKLSENKQVGNSLSNSTSWLGGIIFCKKCDRRMTVTKSGTLRYFSCTGKSNNRICIGVSSTLYADSLENALFCLIAKKLDGLKPPKKAVTTDCQINTMKNRISEIKLLEEKLAETVLEGSLSQDMILILNSKAAALSEEKQTLCKAIAKIEHKHRKPLQIDYSSEWQNADFAKKKAVARLLIDKISISENGDVDIIWKI